MVKKAVNQLNERGGSSRQAIIKFITANYEVGANMNKMVRLTLPKLCESGEFVQVKGRGANGSFKLNTKIVTEISRSVKEHSEDVNEKPTKNKPALKKTTVIDSQKEKLEMSKKQNENVKNVPKKNPKTKIIFQINPEPAFALEPNNPESTDDPESANDPEVTDDQARRKKPGKKNVQKAPVKNQIVGNNENAEKPPRFTGRKHKVKRVRVTMTPASKKHSSKRKSFRPVATKSKTPAKPKTKTQRRKIF